VLEATAMLRALAFVRAAVRQPDNDDSLPVRLTLVLISWLTHWHLTTLHCIPAASPYSHRF